MGKAEDFQRAAELLADPVWRLSNLYYIRDKQGNEVLFTPNWTQTQFLKVMWYFNIILKARQLGFTTLITLFMLDACIFNSNTAAGVIADTDEKAKEIFSDKIKYAYDRLPEYLRRAVETTSDSVHGLEFANGSKIHVGTSMRGLTKQYLLVSELGKIAADSPAKADEIRTGSFNTVHAGQFLFVESTAKGRDGLFFDLCEESRNDLKLGRELTPITFKFHFYPWFLDDSYALPTEQCESMVLTKEQKEYFDRIEQEMDCELAHEQRCWYIEKQRTQKEDMKAEFPSTPDEAFEVSGEGRIYRLEMAKVRETRRIVPSIPVLAGVPVNTFFDIGGASNRKGADYMAAWLCQRVGMENRMVNFHQDTGRGISWWVTWLLSHGYLMDMLYLPHDAKHKRLAMQDAGKSVEELFVDARWPAHKVVVLDRVENKWHDGIGTVRNIFPSVWFANDTCKEGIACLDNYKKEWNAQQAVWRDQPAHDEASHGADAFETFARSNAAVYGSENTGTTTRGGRARSHRTA